ncbi:MAG: Tol-Pal system beta propeller repeat protein TolB [Gammaproteobacteria bacterium]|nr:Tol-Pal system beta propeller repeat protein TolB [Gammaproteobacteria bacterium]
MFRNAGLLILLLAVALPVQADITVKVTKGLGDAQPIAIVPFEFEAGEGPRDGKARPPLDVASVIASDLERSGRFKAFPREDMLEKPSTASDVQFQNWRVLGVDNVVVGKVRRTQGGYVIQFQLLDVFRGKQLLGYSIPVSERSLRRGAHEVSDLIYEELTGIRGAFSTRIAFVMAMKDGDTRRYQLVVADADGYNQSSILRSTSPIMSPVWSPDGRYLAYVSFENDAAEVFVQELATGEREKVSSRPGINGAPSFSPDGRKLALTLSSEPGNPDIWVMDLETKKSRRITRNAAIDTEPTWMPDGKSLLFTSDRGGGPQIYRVEVGSDRAERVTFEGAYNARASVSPDGKSITFVHQGRDGYNIAVMNLDTRAMQVLTDGGLDESPSFAPNGSMIIYATQVGRQGVLAATSTDGRVQQQLGVQEGDVREPAWSPYPPSRE